MGRAQSTHGREKMHTKFQSENLKEGYHSENLGIDRKIILEWILEKKDGKLWAGFIQLRTWNGGGLL
jgi:hypothetical protein